MGFLENIAQALDVEGIESRANDGTLFVPVSAEVEIQFELIEGVAGVSTSAANVFVALADVTDEDEDFDAALVGVVFTPEAAVEAVNRHMATDEVITVLNELLDGQDPRVEDLEFEQDDYDPLVLRANLSANSKVTVKISEGQGTPTAAVNFVVLPDSVFELAENIAAEILVDEEDEQDPAKLDMLDATLDELRTQYQEVLDLGVFEDFNQLFDVLAYVSQQAEDWEDLLVTLDDGSEDPFFEWVEVDDGELEDGGFDDDDAADAEDGGVTEDGE
ncbi:hypothetical protein [Corynebacterium urealyticum]|uniref:Uncharacterized protein n=1 Tax=Corynebacterium urealyticum (strain ATCC 43042 / DSM 7109) TaxID=504474 RepID=B1VFV1_CORU7|nr:hypothetical protein [Corynebacterium urealyticum]QQC41878.1 hypothetical protein I6H51_09400 [Corynebacterium urealyticum]CAQ04640.1 hypothetical protein cu0680 [Corynebacterium urealyticum DSM 7109]SNV79508.1 Uncharacterised protein [Corynebacterium urealyticum]